MNYRYAERKTSTIEPVYESLRRFISAKANCSKCGVRTTATDALFANPDPWFVPLNVQFIDVDDVPKIERDLTFLGQK